MPAVGDQHKAGGSATANPFEDTPTRLSEYTAQEIATLQSRLDKQLGPEYISSRPGAAGQKVHYLAAEKVINLANEVFGFNGWSSAIQNIQIDFVDENTQTGKISLGLSVIVRVTLKDGTFHEDVGYGHIENCKGKAAAFEKAKKEGTTDALKRALRTFGNVLGNCIYDKEFVTKVTKIKIAPSKWDADNLHRHPDYAPIKTEMPNDDDNVKSNSDTGHTSHTEAEEDFGIADFDDGDFGESHTDHPDEVVLPAEYLLEPRPFRMANGPAQSRHSTLAMNSATVATSSGTTPSRPLNMMETTVSATGSRTVKPAGSTISNAQLRMQPPQNQAPQHQHAPNRQSPQTSATTNHQENSTNVHHSSSAGITSQHFAPHAPPPQSFPPNMPPVGFYSARGASHVTQDNQAGPLNTSIMPKFNPHAESPSIRKTAGIDHSKSVPVKRGLAGDASSALLAREGVPPPPAPSRDFVNLSADMHRRIGAPGVAMQSPSGKGGMNASAYRPPTMRGQDSQGSNGAGIAGSGPATAGVKRAPLGDLSNMQPPTAAAGVEGLDIKRTRLSGPENGA